jgi:hypothetical protein
LHDKLHSSNIVPATAHFAGPFDSENFQVELLHFLFDRVTMYGTFTESQPIHPLLATTGEEVQWGEILPGSIVQAKVSTTFYQTIVKNLTPRHKSSFTLTVLDPPVHEQDGSSI